MSYPSKMVSTLADVAKASGVHPGTASKALNPESRHLVAAATVAKVLEAAAELNYQPNSLARGLRTNRSYTVGFMVPDLTNPLFPPIVRGVESVLGRFGLSALIVNTDNNLHKEMQLFTTLLNRRCDGFILATAFLHDPVVEEIVKRGTPAVLVNRITEGNFLPAVAGDEVQGVKDAISYLLSLGHRRIAHIAGPQDLSTGFIRNKAFREAIKESALALRDCPSIIATGFNENAGESAMRNLLESSTELPTAILAGNDQIAVGILDALKAAGIDCPAEISIIGFNDIPMMHRIQPTLTTFSLPKHEMGVKAAQILSEWIETSDAPKPTTYYLPCPLVIRESTGPARLN